MDFNRSFGEDRDSLCFLLGGIFSLSMLIFQNYAKPDQEESKTTNNKTIIAAQNER